MGFPSLKVTLNPWPCRAPGSVVRMRIRVAASHAPSCRQEPGLEPSPEQLRGICFWQRKGFRRAPLAAAGSGRSEHRNVDTLTPIARPRESPTGPNVPCERRTGPAGAPSRHSSSATAPPPRHCKTGEGTRLYAAFLQNAPVVRHTRGFTPGWYAVPRWGTPNAAPRTCPTNRSHGALHRSPDQLRKPAPRIPLDSIGHFSDVRL